MYMYVSARALTAHFVDVVVALGDAVTALVERVAEAVVTRQVANRLVTVVCKRPKWDRYLWRLARTCP